MTLFLAILHFFITIGYLVLAAIVVPQVRLSRFWLKGSASALFATSSFTHAENATNLLLNSNIVHPVTVLNGFVQSAAVWVTIFGLYLEFVVEPSRKKE